MACTVYAALVLQNLGGLDIRSAGANTSEGVNTASNASSTFPLLTFALAKRGTCAF